MGGTTAAVPQPGSAPVTTPGSGSPPVPPRPRSSDEATDSHRDASQAIFADPTRRTYLAQERTLLAWWRTALGTLAVAVAIGAILPKLAQLPKGPYVTLGVGYAILSLWFVFLGAYRQRVNDHALAERRFVGLKPGMVIALSGYMTVLVAATGWVLFWGPGSG